MTKSFKEMQGIKEACWVGYKQVGMKKKGDRMVPNCVKEEVVDAVFGKDYVYQENYQDMYKGKLNKDQIATIKNTWAGKKASDVTQGVRDMVKNMDQFTRMDIKKANIKHISALINDEYDFALPLSDLIEMQEFNAAVRHTELKEFTDEQISKLAKSYADLAGKTMSVQNANKLRKLFDRIPDSSLNKLRKKKIPFLSGLALSRMIQKKIPVNESAYNDESAWEVSGVENEGREELREVKERVPRKGDSFVNYRNKGDISQITRQRHFANSKEADAFKKKVKDMGGKVVHSGVIQNEADLTKSQTKKVHKMADELPKKDFIKRYGKDGDSVRYATATNIIKKKMGIGESKFKLNKGELKMSESYKQRLDSAMGHLGISSLGELNPEDQKPFFTFVDDMKEGLSAAQKKLPPALQKAIAKKQDDKSEKHKPGHNGNMKEDLVGGQKKLDKDKDGDIDAKDFAKLRSMKKEYGMAGNVMASKNKKSMLSMPIKPASKMKEEKTKETDSEPKMKDLNAMVKDPHKSKEDKPMKDMNAMYMKSNVKAPVKDGGGADMAKVKDKPIAQEPMKKINGMYKENHRYLQTKPGSLEEAVLKSRGLIKSE